MSTAGRLSFAAALLLAPAWLAPPADAQFSAYTWTLVNPDSPANYVLGDEMHIEGTPIGFGMVDTRYVTTAPASGTFVVSLSSTVLGFGPNDGPYTYRNGFQQPICKSCSTTATLDVVAGDSFGFGLAANDFLQATVTYTNLIFVPKPVVHSISPTLAFLEEDVVITGEGFGPDTTVVVDGVPQTVLSWTPTQLVIAPGPHAPGRFDVRVTNAGVATTKLTDAIAFLPTLAITSDGVIGAGLAIEYSSGTPGLYLLFYGLHGLPAPLPAANAYYGLLIDPSAPFGLLVGGSFAGGAPLALSFTLPDEPVLAGTPFHLQVLAQQVGAPGGISKSFTNAVSGVLHYETTTTLHVLEKPAPAHADGFGETLAAIGDVNRDGVPDLAVGAPASDENGSSAGSVRVYSGATGATLLTLLGGAASARFGNALAGAGDLNGDGVPDFVVGAEGAAVVTVHSGADASVLLTLPGANTAVAGLGDLNVDGVPEIGVGNGTFNTSRVSVYSGATGALLRQHTAPNQDSLGASLASIGDVNQDTIPDYAAGAPANGCTLIGTPLSYVNVYSGRNGGLLLQFTAPICDDFGTSVAAAGDVNLDGWPDILVGAPAKTGESLSPKPGYARVHSGLDGAVIHEFTAGPLGLNQFFDPASERFGESVAGAGDVNGDGVPDLLVGVPFTGSNPITALGAVRIYSGAYGTLLYELTGTSAGAWLGDAVAGLGDLNGDGLADFAAGAPRESVGTVQSGRVIVWSGVPLR
ncbi:MAG: IPT/TIG domain-containing protein [Planctomycetota bacterium]